MGAKEGNDDTFLYWMNTTAAKKGKNHTRVRESQEEKCPPSFFTTIHTCNIYFHFRLGNNLT